MANNCFIDIKIETETAEQAKGLCKKLQAAFKRADRENVGAYFGSSDRYFFEGKAEHEGTEVFIGGWVKWGYSDGEFIDMFSWLRRKVAIKKFQMHYEELLTDQYGEYELHDDGTMWNTFLPEKDFPAAMADYEAYVEKVEEAFRTKPTTRLIKVD